MKVWIIETDDGVWCDIYTSKEIADEVCRQYWNNRPLGWCDYMVTEYELKSSVEEHFRGRSTDKTEKSYDS